MSDIKLFHINNNKVTELEGKSVTIEKSLQSLIETHLETFLGIKFLETEYSTGVKHGGRIDTLGIDENNCPVIIEYKRSTNENVINQGLFYLDWLLDHKGEFQILVQKVLNSEIADSIEWENSRLILIAGDFTKYDIYAVQQISRNIELYRYKKFDNILLFELINSVNVTPAQSKTSVKKTVKEEYIKTNKIHVSKSAKEYRTVTGFLERSSPQLKDLYETIKDYLMNLGDEVQFKVLLFYFAFKRIKTFASIEIHPKTDTIVVYVRLDPNTIKFEEGFTRDVSNIGHLGVGNIEIRIKNLEDFEKAKPYILKSYELS